jgi:hypothetical protein
MNVTFVIQATVQMHRVISIIQCLRRYMKKDLKDVYEALERLWHILDEYELAPSELEELREEILRIQTYVEWIMTEED